jgi:STE24 endopeptidase
VFSLTIAVITAVFALDLTLSMLNYKHRDQPIPANVADVYDEAGYQKWLDYTMETYRLSILVKLLNTTVLLLFLFLGVFPALARIAEGYMADQIFQTLLFMGFYFLISYLLNIGFDWYRTFNIEERYGFNQSTIKTFLLDQVKSIGLSLVLGGFILYVLLFLYLQTGSRFILYAWLFAMVLSLVVNVLYTKVFVRIFNKLSPLPEGELQEKIISLAKMTGYEIRKISVIDASKRSARLNAFFSGFGRFKHIVLFDTLLEKCGSDEIISVLAHEIGHARHRDVLRNFFISMVQTSVALAALSFFLASDSMAQAFGFPEAHLGFALILFSILIEPFGILLGIPLSALSRKAEYRADRYAAQTSDPAAMISALKVLARENFANLTPHPLVVKMTYSHPPISQRIEAIDNYQTKNLQAIPGGQAII